MREGRGGGEEKKTTRMTGMTRRQTAAGGDGVCDFCLQAPVFQDAFGGVCARVCCVLCVCVCVCCVVVADGESKSGEQRVEIGLQPAGPRECQGRHRSGFQVFFPWLVFGHAWAASPDAAWIHRRPRGWWSGVTAPPDTGTWQFQIHSLSQSGPFLLFSFSPLMGWLSPCVTTTGGSAERSATWYRGGPTD